jgi:hypothetical protein
MPTKFTPKQLAEFRVISDCEHCVHYVACPFWIALLFANHENTGEFLKMMLPDIEQPCVMFAKHPMFWGQQEDTKETKRAVD